MIPRYERDVAKDFGKVMENYPLLVPNNTAQAGWPDRFIQLPKSRIVACEIKIALLNKQNYFMLSEFRQSQAVWMAKWQKEGGLAMLFIGINSLRGFVGYGIITCKAWSDWLNVRVTKQDTSTVSFHNDIGSVRDWFTLFVRENEYA